MKTLTMSSTFALLFLVALALLLLTSPSSAQVDDKGLYDNIKGLELYPPGYGPRPHINGIDVITTPDGYDNFDVGIDNAEQHMSVNPNNILQMVFGVNSTVFRRTEDGALTWAVATPPGTNSGDPFTAYDSSGNVYVQWLSGSSNPVFRSTNNGVSWSSGVTSASGSDRNTLAADQSGGPFSGYVYAGAWSPNCTFARSTNNGASFTITLTKPNTTPGVIIAIGANVLNGQNVQGGCVYFTSITGANPQATTFNFWRSTDGGASFDSMSSLTVAGYVGSLNTATRLVINNARTRPYPMVAADNSFGPYRGRLYLAYASNEPPGNGNKPDVFIQYSTDQGATWTPRSQRINDNANPELTNEWFPAIWCDKNTGRLYAKWYDMRDDPTNQRAWVYATYSDDGGQTFVPNVKLSNADMPYPGLPCSPNTNCYRGDYDHITSAGDVAIAIWTDFRNSNYQNTLAYFPDFAMLASPTIDTLQATDSANFVIKVPSVKYYNGRVKFSATVSPAANFTLSFIGRDSLATYPDSVRLKVKTTNVANGTYTVTVTGKGPKGTPVHRRNITILVASPFVTVVQPNGGEQLFVGQTYPINWSRYLVDTVKVEYSTNGGSSWILIHGGTPGDAPPIHPKLRMKHQENAGDDPPLPPYNWTVPNTPSTNCLVRLSHKSTPSVRDSSDAPFSILAIPNPQWSARASGTSAALYAVSVIDTLRAWAAGDSGKVFRTLTGGASWVASGNLTDPVWAIYGIDASRAIAATNATGRARIQRTITGGLSWSVAYQDTSPSAFIDAVAMFDANNGYAVGDPVGGNWTLLRTTDGGATWSNAATLAQAGTESGFNSSMSWVGQNGWFGTNNSRVYRTTNGGATWTSGTTAFVNSFAVSFATASLGIATGSGTARSTNGGATWTATPVSPPVTPFGAVSVTVPQNRWYLVSGSAVYKTTDQGTTFPVDFSQSNTYRAIDMKVVVVSGNTWLTGYAVGNSGTITKYQELALVQDVGQQTTTPNQYTLVQNYPNPFNPSTQIKYVLPEESRVVLAVYDVLGQRIATLVDGVLTGGDYAQVWNGHSDAGALVSSGVYFYRLDAKPKSGSPFTSIRKMVLIK
jgi:photosystem II stability/assembly factor-like uncharacterized protein